MNRFYFMPGQVALQPPVQIFVQQNAHSGKSLGMGLRFFQQGNDLLPCDTGKTFEKIFNGIAGFEMIEKAFDRYTRSPEDGFAPENLRILNNHFAHDLNGSPEKKCWRA